MTIKYFEYYRHISVASENTVSGITKLNIKVKNASDRSNRGEAWATEYKCLVEIHSLVNMYLLNAYSVDYHKFFSLMEIALRARIE